jgi:hypothetical protein
MEITLALMGGKLFQNLSFSYEAVFLRGLQERLVDRKLKLQFLRLPPFKAWYPMRAILIRFLLPQGVL